MNVDGRIHTCAYCSLVSVVGAPPCTFKARTDVTNTTASGTNPE